ncbi:hypothetical protein [Lysobacter sp. A421]
MLYIIAALMGYIIATNIFVSRAAQRDIGSSFVSPTANLLLSLGGFAGWFCILPAAYFAGSADGNGFLQGILFVLASLGGGLLASFIRIPGLSQLIAILALFLNVGLAVLVYYVTRN